MTRGNFNVSRSIFHHPMFDGQPMTRREAWLWLIGNAAWRPMQVLARNGRASELVNLQRGQLTFSRSFLREKWKWSSEKTVRTFLTRLEREHMIDLQTGQLQTVITVRNYDVFQSSKSLAGPAIGPAKGQQRAGNGPEEETLINIRSNILPPPSPAGFDAWYSIYPRKKEPQAARKAFAKVIGSSLIALPALMERTRAFAATWGNEPKDRRKFIPYPASWLNAGGYDDEPEGGSEPARGLIDPLTFDDDGWRRRLKYFRDAEKWIDAWGPEPGEPGCLVPSHLLLSPVSNSKGAA